MIGLTGAGYARAGTGKSLENCWENGAARENRTLDLTLTKGALYH
tara:strand:+ start:1543 stop:1677 length:135 start_codon:yes stop_codon:yes gene_type:complete